ncbi:MAG: TonB-dependent receptor, partial [Bacteroidota bacterium]
MKKVIVFSLACSLWINAAEVELETIHVDTKVDTEVIKDVSGEDIKSADLAEALFKQSPSVALSRRSGIANDIVVRAQRKDNINVTIDGAKVHGACPNRMDPPISHILTNNVDYIEINEGPFNVEDFGALSADVKIHTIKPTEEFEGEVNLGLGSWGYKKGSFALSGGISENVRVLLTGSMEESEQYEDGDGNDFADQVDNYIADNLTGTPMDMMLMGTAYQDKYRDMDAYSKKTLMAKLFWDIADNQELRLSYTANRSDDVLYPSTPMDALYDDSDIFNVEYIAKDLGIYSKELNIQFYQSEVDHPMSNLYRKSATDLANEKTHALTSQIQGAKLTNSFDVDNHIITVGLDYSKRNWDGQFFANGVPALVSINDVDTKNVALFIKDKITMDKFVLDLGLRYDDTEITSEYPNTLQPDNNYNELNGYVLGTYNANENTKYFAGFGKSSRVPDARELYLRMPNPAGGVREVGNPGLENTVNYEFDIGAEKKYENATIKAKAFYSMLNDFIAYNVNGTADGHNLENVDATIYGFELSGTYVATDSLYFDYGMSYQRGKKDDPLTGQSDTDMPEIPPFKFNGAVNYDYDDTLVLRAEVIASDEWSNFDADNGEQELDSYAVLNLKGTKKFGKHFELTVGVDNLFDSTYAVTNTYNDITLLPSIGSDSNVILLNEPGRYVYTNIKYKF